MQPGAQVRPGLLVAAEIEFQTCIGACLLLARGRLGGQHRMHIELAGPDVLDQPTQQL